MLRWDSRTRAPSLSVCHRAPGLPKCPGVQEYLQLQSSHNTQLPAVAAAVTVSARPRSWPSLGATSPQQRWFLEDAFAPKPFPSKRKHGLDRATAPRPGGLGGTWVWHKAPRPGGAARMERTWPLGHTLHLHVRPCWATAVLGTQNKGSCQNPADSAALLSVSRDYCCRTQKSRQPLTQILAKSSREQRCCAATFTEFQSSARAPFPLHFLFPHKDVSPPFHLIRLSLYRDSRGWGQAQQRSVPRGP